MKNKILSLLPQSDSLSFGIYRFLYFGWLLIYFTLDFNPVGYYPLFPAIEDPIGIFSVFSQNIFRTEVVTYVYPLWVVCLFLSCIGLWTRASMILALVFGYWVLGHTMAAGVQSYQHFPHYLSLLVFACSKGGKDFSIDKKVFGLTKSYPNWEYQIPVFLLRSILILLFFSAGVSKIRDGALHWWLSNQNTMDVFLRASFGFIGFETRSYFPEINKILSSHAGFAFCAVIMAFLLEILSPLVVFKKWKWPILIGFILFQAMAVLALFVDFKSIIGLYLMWLPTAWLGKQKRDL